MIKKIVGEDLRIPEVTEWKKALDEYSGEARIKLINGAFGLDNEIIPFTPRTTKKRIPLIARIAIDKRLPESPSSFFNDKYILLQSFYDFGKSSTIDLVGLPLATHFGIAKTYLRECLPNEVETETFSSLPFDLDPPIFSRYIIGGGDVVRTPQDNIQFKGRSLYFSGNHGVYNTKDIAHYILRESGLSNVPSSEDQSVKNGEEYIRDCLEFMKEYGGDPKFYSLLPSFYGIGECTPRYISPLDTLIPVGVMKSIDEGLRNGNRETGLFLRNLIRVVENGRSMSRCEILEEKLSEYIGIPKPLRVRTN